jgi:integrase
MSARLVATRTPGIFKRGSRYVIRFRAPDGRVRQRAARTMAEARNLKSTLSTDVRRGEYRELSTITFSDYAAQWIETYTGRTSRGIRPATVADYKRILEREATPFFGRMRLAEIEPQHIKQYAKAVADRGVKPNTVRLAVAPVKALFATAFEEGVIRTNPAAGLRLATGAQVEEGDPSERVMALTEAELQNLLEKIAPEWQLFVTLVAHTGMRIGEAVAVQWDDVDFGVGRLNVRRRWYRGTFAAPKSRYGRRSIPLTESMSRALWERRKQAPDARGGALIWATASGMPYNRSNLHARVIKPAARAAGVPWAGWHSLRHTCATMLFRSGANAKQVQVWLGHHSPAFTLATYVHLLPDDAADAAFWDRIAPAANPPLPGANGVEGVSSRVSS